LLIAGAQRDNSMKRDLATALSEIRSGKAPAVLLLHGDDFRVQSATKAIVDQLVPSENRAFNLESFNGQSTPWDQIEAALMTPPFFAGTKAILIENAPYFHSSEHKGGLAEKIFQLWSEGRKEEAARLLAQLLGLEGWTQEQWEGFQGSFSATQLADLFDDPSREAREDLDEILAFCRTHRITLGAFSKGEEKRLTEFLERGLPPWAVLLITASHLDRRTRLYKIFEEKGGVLDLTLERDRTGRISRERVAEFVDRRLKEAGKKIESQAKEILLARAGEELWAIHQELEKLLLYVGEDPWIKSKDVEEAFLDHGEGWIFDLTGAIAERDSVRALGYLERLLSQGEHPLKLLATIASEVRRLLVARQLIEGELRHKWRKQMSYQQFQASIPEQGMPVLTRSMYGDYMTFTKADNFTSQELLRFLDSIYQTDIRLKSTGHSPRILMERLILEMCRGSAQRKMQNED
jgi:DNA polymerase-3 subunit delta